MATQTTPLVGSTAIACTSSSLSGELCVVKDSVLPPGWNALSPLTDPAHTVPSGPTASGWRPNRGCVPGIAMWSTDGELVPAPCEKRSSSELVSAHTESP